MTQQKPGSKRKIPMRKCCGCGEMMPKKELLRVIRTPENEIVLDLTGKKNGRGAYLCKSTQCFLKAKKSKVLERSLEVAIPDSVYSSLSEQLEQETAEKT